MKLRRPLGMVLTALLFVCTQALPPATTAAIRTVDKHADDGSPGTLRHEIGQSQDGDIIDITTGATIVLTKGQISISTMLTIRAQSNATAILESGFGARIFEVGAVAVTLARLQLQNSFLLLGGGGAVRGINCDLELDNCVIRDNLTLEDGGGIHITGGTLSIRGCTLTGNIGLGFGGGLYLDGTDVVVTSSTFRFNGDFDETRGGAIFGVNGDYLISHSLFTRNASNGSGGGLHLRDVAATIANCNIWENKGFGGGRGLFFEADNTTASLDMTYTRVTSHTVGSGSAVEFNGYSGARITASISFCEFGQSGAGNGGEGLEFDSQGPQVSELIVQQSTFANNAGSGIDIVSDGGLVLIEECDVYDNEDDDAGGIRVGAATPGAVIDILNTNIFNNRVNSNVGGGVRVNGFNNIVNIRGCLIENNSATANAGGGIAYNSVKSSLVENCIISNNRSLDEGGGIFASAVAQNVTIASCTIASNRSTSLHGGGIYSSAPQLLITSATITGNSAASNGGAIYLADGVLTAASCSFVGNTSASSGGVFFVNQGTLDAIDCSIRKSKAIIGSVGYFNGGGPSIVRFIDSEIVTNGTCCRGGVFHLPNANINLTLDGVHIEDNATSSEGGAIYMGNGILNVTSCSFVNNRAASGTEGGALSMWGGTAEFHSTTFANNRSNFNGGAIFKRGGTMDVAHCSFRGNVARDGRGGGILHWGGITRVTSSSFSANTASDNGGGFAANAIFADLFNCTFSGNEAGNLGGGVYSSAPGLDIAFCTITGNIADSDNNGTGDGGGIWATTDILFSNLIAGNTDRGGECPDVGVVSGSDGFNLIGDVGQFNFSSNTTGDQYGDPNGVVTPNPGALESATVIDAKLEALADNGGFGQTHALQLCSPAFGASTTAGIALLDQRGEPRLDVPDIGAFELSVPLTIIAPASVCLGTPAKVTLDTPLPGASYSWSVFNGEVASGQNSTCASVKIQALAGGGVTLTETLSLGGVRSTSMSFEAVVFAAMDHASVSSGQMVEIDVLANDTGGSLSLLAAGNPTIGSVTISSAGTLLYTAAASSAGCESFNYSIENSDGCVATGAVIVAVQPAIVNYVNLEFIEREKDRRGGVRGLRRVNDVAASPDGKHVYAAGWSDNSIAMFERTVTSGTLRYIGRVRHGRRGVTRMRYPAALALSPDGRHLYAVAYRDNAIVVFSRNASDGTLSYVDHLRHGQNGVLGMQRPRGLAISPDGSNVYVAAFSGDALAVFGRDLSSGALRFIEHFQDNSGSVDGLNGALDVTVSLDGLSVFVAGHSDDALAQFDRALSDGSLSYRQCFKDGASGIDGLAGAASVVVSPDTRFVYVAGSNDNAVATFRRTESTGNLSFLQRIRDGAPGVNGLARASDLAISKDGANLYVAGESDNALTVFTRDLNSGELTPAHKLQDGRDGVDGLRQLRALTVTDDSKHIYAAGRGDNALAAFELLILPNGESKTVSRLRSESTIFVTVQSQFPADLPVTLQGQTSGTFGNVTLWNELSLSPTSKSFTFKYDVVVNDFPDAFSYTLENANGTTTHTIRVVEQLVKSAIPGTENAGDVRQASPASIPLAVSPNPARELVNIEFNLPEDAQVRIRMYDAQGRLVGGLPEMELKAGGHRIPWNVSTESGARLSQGSYVLLLQAYSAADPTRIGSVPLNILR